MSADVKVDLNRETALRFLTPNVSHDAIHGQSDDVGSLKLRFWDVDWGIEFDDDRHVYSFSQLEQTGRGSNFVTGSGADPVVLVMSIAQMMHKNREADAKAEMAAKKKKAAPKEKKARSVSKKEKAAPKEKVSPQSKLRRRFEKITFSAAEENRWKAAEEAHDHYYLSGWRAMLMEHGISRDLTKHFDKFPLPVQKKIKQYYGLNFTDSIQKDTVHDKVLKKIIVKYVTPKTIARGKAMREKILKNDTKVKKYGNKEERVAVKKFSLAELKKIGKEKGIRQCKTKKEYAQALGMIN